MPSRRHTNASRKSSRNSRSKPERRAMADSASVFSTSQAIPGQAIPLRAPRRRLFRGHLQGSEYAWALAFCVPYIFVFIAFVVYPVAFGVWMGSDTSLYSRLFSDPIYLETLVNTALYLGVAI